MGGRTKIVAVAIVLALVLYIPFSPPRAFPVDMVVTIPPATTVIGTGEILSSAGIVRSALLFRVLNSFGVVHTGTYLFEKPQNVVTVASRLRTGAYGYEPRSITFPEGDTSREMAERVAAVFSDISTEEFRKEARHYEGYLFPDTYLFMPYTSSAAIVEKMRNTFTEKTSSLAEQVSASGRSWSDTVIMASILEKEARTPESRRMISGILWNRIKLGMPLQVDAVFGYIFDTDTYSPSFADLKVDSPYNTYMHRGLPPGPISNPGLDSIIAALNPAQTSYLYYLTGSDDKMHYATTYAGHQANQRTYLR
jgi:UPF0755 protein